MPVPIDPPTGHGTVRPTASAAIMTISLEMLGVALFSLLAGASTDAGHIMVLIMVSLWVLFLITNAGAVASLVAGLGSLVSHPTNK